MRLTALNGMLCVLALFGAMAGLGGCVPGATYGTGERPEVAMFREVTGGVSMGLIPGKKKKQPIEYQPRAALVMPSSGEVLPAPVEVASAANPDWPTEPDDGPKTFDEDARAGGSQAEYQRLKPLAALSRQRTRDTGMSADSDMHDEAYDVIGKKKQRETFQAALDDAEGVGRTERRYLTEPPDAYRQPATTAPQEFDDIKKTRKSWLAGLFGG